MWVYPPHLGQTRRKPCARAVASASAMSVRPRPVCCASALLLSAVAMSCPYTCSSRTYEDMPETRPGRVSDTVRARAASRT